MAIITRKTIFYHIPKTGGMWVRAALKNAGVRYTRINSPDGISHPLYPIIFHQHATPDMIDHRFKDHRFSFCMVRHPINWYKSYWCMKMRSQSDKDDKSLIDRLLCDNYNTWVNAVLDAYPQGFLNELYSQYADCTKMNYIGRTESLEASLIAALTLAGEKFDLHALIDTPRTNIAAFDKKYGRCAVMNRDTKRRVITTERWVMETFYEI